MLKQNYSKVKKILILLLAVFFVTTLTIATVNAADNSVTEVTQLEQINAALQKGPVLLEIGAEWAGDCQKMKPILQELATEYAGRATIMTIDIDKSPDLATYFNIAYVPDTTLIMSIKNGEYVYLQEDGQLTTDRLKAKILGQMEKEVYEKRINLALNYKKAPVAAFSVSLTSGNSPLKVQFTDKSTGSPTSWKWNFGDGSTSTSKSPAHTYSKVGKYTVSLTVKNAAGSSTKTIKNYITVKTPVKPVAAFSASPTSGKAPLTVVFKDKSTGSPTSWKWSFGDGTVKTSQNPTHTYSKVGNYTVKLTVTNAIGSNTITKTNYIKVLGKPVAAFTASPRSGTKPLKVQFTDKSTGSPTSWKWNFGDGTTSTTHNPLHTYIKKGKLTVTLTATNAAGSSTKTMTSYITVK